VRPLRFCMVTTFYPPANFGGDGVQVQRLARALAVRGHEVTVVHAVDAFRALARRREEGVVDDPGVRVVPIETRTGSLAPLATHLTGRPLLSRRRLERALEGPFDVIHFHNPSLIGGPGVLGMGRGTLRLYTAHEQWLVCPTHVLWKNNREVCEKPTCTRCSLSYRRPPQLWRSGGHLQRALAHLDALIVPSRTSGRLHERFTGTVRIEHIPHFVPEPPAAGTSPQRRPYFLFVGRHERLKGLHKLIDAFRSRTSEDLLIAGTGPITNELRRAAIDLPHVRFLGWQDAEELDGLYRDALAVVVPTLGHESFGLVPVEGFARARPAIVHGFGALGELIDESGAGIAYRTARELAAALDRIAGDPSLRAALGQRGRAAYLAHWTEERHLQRYLALVEQLAAQRGASELEAAARAGPRAARPPAPEQELAQA
jgi:glycosyltransferase involved in cell wall biosynthesis